MTRFFHVYNRGVDKRKVFLSDSDRARFIHDLWEFNDAHKAYNSGRHASNSPMIDVRRQSLVRKPLVQIHCFCLMPNHYHLLASPADDDMENLSLFMKKLGGGYTKYFNEKHERSGALWQGKYKKVEVITDAHFLYLPFYIHFNTLDLMIPEWRDGNLPDIKDAEQSLGSYRWSSHLDYLGKRNFPSVTDRSFLLDLFGGEKSYGEQTRNILNSKSTLDDLDEGIILE